MYRLQIITDSSGTLVPPALPQEYEGVGLPTRLRLMSMYAGGRIDRGVGPSEASETVHVQSSSSRSCGVVWSGREAVVGVTRHPHQGVTPGGRRVLPVKD